MKNIFLFALLYGATVSWAQLPSGVIWNDSAYLKLPFKIDYGQKESTLVSSYSLKAHCPKVVNQKGMGTSVAWATVWYAQTMAEHISCLMEENGRIEKNAYAPLYPYRIAKPSGDCTEGVDLVAFLNALYRYGTPRFNEFDDLCPNVIPPTLQNKAISNRLDGFTKLFNPFDPQELKVNAVKQSISAARPVVIGMLTPSSFTLAGEFWQARETPQLKQPAQALCIVGYDDNKFGGAFEVVNQWGKSWGAKGYTWIRYSDFHKFVRYGFEIFHGRKCLPMPESTFVIHNEKGQVLLSGNVDNKMHSVTTAQPIGSKFRLTVQTRNGSFMYLLIRDKHTMTALFPSNSLNKNPFIDKDLTLPDADGYFVLEGESQINTLILVCSKTQLTMEEVITQLGQLQLDGNREPLMLEGDFAKTAQIAVLEIEQR